MADAGLTGCNLHRNRVELRIIALGIGFDEGLELICAGHRASFFGHTGV